MPLEGSGCIGDSGSPLYVTVADQELIVGALHGPAPGPDGGPPLIAGCGYGAVVEWAPLADPVNVAFLEGADSAIAFVPEPGSLSALRGGCQNSRTSLPATRNRQAAWSRDCTMKPSRS